MVTESLVESCVQVLSSETESLLSIIAGYLGVILILVLYELTLGVLNGLDEIGNELSSFVEDYKTTSHWWTASLFTTIVALTIGSNPGIVADFLVLSIFFSPAIYYFHTRYPFSLGCDFRARSSSGQTIPGQTREKVCRLNSNDEYLLELVIKTGKTVDEFCFDLTLPAGVEARNIQSVHSLVRLDKNDNQLLGKAPVGEDSIAIDLIIVPNTGVRPGGGYLIITDEESGRNLEQVRLLGRDKS
ncbi:hypothetical protein [Haloarchaeobius sp. DYHT-AS-18]|uniref:hypothetical protein n=1 Tax=Haloarchaeobius sp. DYHT-AS-18 TaxID=3446117 RepID=UPI003EBED93B